MGPIHVLDFAPAPPRVEGAKLRIHVIYTTPQATRACLRAAGLLAKGLDARLELLVTKVVPYPLPLHRPTTSAAFTEKTVGTLTRNCGIDVNVKVLLCRDAEETIPRWLPSDSIAVIGRRRRWGPGSCSRLIRAIRRSGLRVIVVPE